MPAAMDLDPVASLWVWAVSAVAGAAAVSVEDAASAGTVRDRQGQHHQQDQEQRGDLFLKQFHIDYLQNDSIRK